MFLGRYENVFHCLFFFFFFEIILLKACRIFLRAKHTRSLSQNVRFFLLKNFFFLRTSTENKSDSEKNYLKDKNSWLVNFFIGWDIFHNGIEVLKNFPKRKAYSKSFSERTFFFLLEKQLFLRTSIENK